MDNKLKEQIKSFLENNRKKSIKFEHLIAVQELYKILKSLGFDPLELSGEETNGWQIDFWYYFTHKKYGKFCYGGSLHYGEPTFSKTE